MSEYPFNAADPKTDRELLLQLSGQMDRLSEAIDRLDDTLKEIENKKLVLFDRRLTAVEKWQYEANGIYKAVVIASGILSIVALIRSFFPHL